MRFENPKNEAIAATSQMVSSLKPCSRRRSISVSVAAKPCSLTREAKESMALRRLGKSAVRQLISDLFCKNRILTQYSECGSVGGHTVLAAVFR